MALTHGHKIFFDFCHVKLFEPCHLIKIYANCCSLSERHRATHHIFYNNLLVVDSAQEMKIISIQFSASKAMKVTSSMACRERSAYFKWKFIWLRAERTSSDDVTKTLLHNVKLCNRRDPRARQKVYVLSERAGSHTRGLMRQIYQAPSPFFLILRLFQHFLWLCEY